MGTGSSAVALTNQRDALNRADKRNRDIDKDLTEAKLQERRTIKLLLLGQCLSTEILMIFSSQAALKVVILTTFGAASDKNIVKITFRFSNYTVTEMWSFWRHVITGCTLKCQLSVTPVMKILSKWRHSRLVNTCTLPLLFARFAESAVVRGKWRSFTVKFLYWISLIWDRL